MFEANTEFPGIYPLPRLKLAKVHSFGFHAFIWEGPYVSKNILKITQTVKSGTNQTKAVLILLCKKLAKTAWFQAVAKGMKALGGGLQITPETKKEHISQRNGKFLGKYMGNVQFDSNETPKLEVWSVESHQVESFSK